jgi:hypothetical protein
MIRTGHTCYFLILVLKIFSDVSLCECMSRCTGTCRGHESVRSPGTGVTCCCEMPSADFGNCTWDFWNSSKYSDVLSQFSRPQAIIEVYQQSSHQPRMVCDSQKAAITIELNLSFIFLWRTHQEKYWIGKRGWQRGSISDGETINGEITPWARINIKILSKYQKSDINPVILSWFLLLEAML